VLGHTPEGEAGRRRLQVGNRLDPGAGEARGRRRRHLLATLGVAVVVALVAAMPVLAQDEGGEIGPQVVGGKPVSNGEYRFMTSIQADLSKKRPPYKEHFCGGTLIDANSVMTAAHCVVFFGRQTNEESLGFRDVRLDVGVTVLNTDQGKPRKIERLSHVKVHPDYNGRRNNKFDVAVIRLNKPVNGIDPIVLADPSLGDTLEDPPDDAIVAGWGDTRPQPPTGGVPSKFPKRMQEGTPPLVSDAQCDAAYDRPQVDPRLEVYPRLMVCAGQTAEDTCQGDSGGPMFVEDATLGRRQIGITSYGLGCGATGFPGVYTEVNAEPIYDFITRAAGL
jgi:secreted trypsin-like serine protease